MVSNRLAACLFGAISICLSAGVSAATVYEAVRIDSRTGKRDLDVRMLIDGRDMRIDVSASGEPRVSLIKMRHRLIAINHIDGVYSVRDLRRDELQSQIPFPPAQITSRRQFALGSYCHVSESHWSESVYQEQCLIGSSTAFDAGLHLGASANDFLTLIAATADAARLFGGALQTNMRQPNANELPVIIRHFEQGQALFELRILAAKNGQTPRNAFGVPRGLHRIAVNSVLSRQALR